MINFTPERGHLLICDFDMANVPPEMRKKRRVAVVSPRSYNRGGRCLVVPFSATAPRDPSPATISFEVGRYRSLTVQTWAICDALSHVSHTRLDRVKTGREFLSELLSESDILRLEVGLRHALGMA